MDLVDLNPTPAEVWNVLNSINVNDRTEKKNGLTYLSWAWAWQIVKNHYPEIQVTWRPEMWVENNGERTCMVSCAVTVGPNVSQEMFLPVMDNKMNALKNPDTRDISDTRQRCLVKALALLGLGVYIYAGEDLPRETTPGDVGLLLVKEVKQLVKELKAKGREFTIEEKTKINAALVERDPDLLLKVKNELQKAA